MWEDRRHRIRHEGARTLWQQIADDIKAEIKAGRIARGSRLPGLLELADSYGVSDHTIRRVFHELRKEGVVIVVNGRGTFVAE